MLPVSPVVGRQRASVNWTKRILADCPVRNNRPGNELFHPDLVDRFAVDVSVHVLVPHQVFTVGRYRNLQLHDRINWAAVLRYDSQGVLSREYYGAVILAGFITGFIFNIDHLGIDHMDFDPNLGLDYRNLVHGQCLPGIADIRLTRAAANESKQKKDAQKETGVYCQPKLQHLNCYIEGGQKRARLRWPTD